MTGERPPKRTWVSSGTKAEEIAGYACAVRTGNRILVSGTTATSPDGTVGVGDAAAQTRFILDRIERALRELGATVNDVVRTRVYVRHIEDWEAVARVHGAHFGAIRPACTLVQAHLIGDDILVQIEVEAETRGPRRSRGRKR